MTDVGGPDEDLRALARRVSAEISREVPEASVEVIDDLPESYVVVLVHPPRPDRKFVAIMLFYNGGYQVEVYGVFEKEADLPRPFEQTLAEVTDTVVMLVRHGVPGYAPW